LIQLKAGDVFLILLVLLFDTDADLVVDYSDDDDNKEDCLNFLFFVF
jgi:hypothetical protein